MERDRISAIKFDAARHQFLSDVFVVVAVAVALAVVANVNMIRHVQSPCLLVLNRIVTSLCIMHTLLWNHVLKIRIIENLR